MICFSSFAMVSLLQFLGLSAVGLGTIAVVAEIVDDHP